MKRLICCKVILLILSIGLSCCCVYGKDKLSKTEKQALKWLEKGEKLDNGVVRITLPGDYLSLLNDEKVLETIETRSMFIWKEANSRNAFYYCIPFENIASLFPDGLLSGIDYPMTQGNAVMYNGKFILINGLSWFGKVENGMLEGKGYGFCNGEKYNFIFYGEFKKGIPVGDFYCVNPKGESIYKQAKQFRESLVTPSVKVSPFTSGWSKIMERDGKGYKGVYMNTSYEKVMFLDNGGGGSLLQNCGQSFAIVDFSEFKNDRATISYTYKYETEEQPRGVLKMEIDQDLAFAGFLPESDKEITTLLDRIIAAQIKALNPRDLKDPRTVLEKRGVDYRDYRFCNCLKSVIGRTYEGSKRYNKSNYNPTLIQAFPHLWNRLEMINSLESLFNLISSQLVGYRGLLNEEARRGHLKKSGIDKEWLSRKISQYMTTISSLAPDPIFPKVTAGGLKALETEINKIDKSFLSAYNEAKKTNDEVLAKRAEERRKRAEQSSGGWSGGSNSTSETPSSPTSDDSGNKYSCRVQLVFENGEKVYNGSCKAYFKGFLNTASQEFETDSEGNATITWPDGKGEIINSIFLEANIGFNVRYTKNGLKLENGGKYTICMDCE